MRTPLPIGPFQNYLLAALPSLSRERLLPFLNLCPLTPGKVLYESGENNHHVYFPANAIVSLQYVTRDGHSSEFSVVGNEGVVGISQFLGGGGSQSRAVVLSAGTAYRISAHNALTEFERRGVLMELILIYTKTLMTQIGQTAFCNRYHKLEQQLPRWLLFLLDCLPTNELVITHEVIANLLGVRRESVTEGACKLQQLGVIQYSRGHIQVLDRKHLESLSCECYGVVKTETDRLLAGLTSQDPASTAQPAVSFNTSQKKSLPIPSHVKMQRRSAHHAEKKHSPETSACVKGHW